MAGRQGRPAGSHRPLDAHQMASDDVGVALAHHQLIKTACLSLGPMKPVENLGLRVVLGRVRGVLVFRSLTVWHLADPEPHGAPLGVEDRKHDSSPEEVVLTTPLVDPPETGRPQVVIG